MEEKIRCAQVAVEKALPSFDRLFDYLVPDHMDLKPGCRVLVPFGSGGPRVGMVFSMDPPERREGLKPILRQLDSQPCLEEKQLALAAFLQERTFCTWFDAVRLLLPLGVSLQVSLCYTPLEKERLKEVSGGLAPVAGLLARTRKGVTPAAAAKALEVGEDTALSSLEELCRMGLAQKETVARGGRNHRKAAPGAGTVGTGGRGQPEGADLLLRLYPVGAGDPGEKRRGGIF